MNRARFVAVRFTAAQGLSFALFLAPGHAAADAGATQRQAVQFAKGTTSAQVRGAVKGERDVEYTVSAQAGQTLAVSST